VIERNIKNTQVLQTNQIIWRNFFQKIVAEVQLLKAMNTHQGSIQSVQQVMVQTQFYNLSFWLYQILEQHFDILY